MIEKSKPEKEKTPEKVTQPSEPKKESHSEGGFSWDDLLEEFGGDTVAEENERPKTSSESKSKSEPVASPQELVQANQSEVYRHHDLKKTSHAYRHQAKKTFQHDPKKVGHSQLSTKASRAPKLPTVSSDKHTRLFLKTVGEVIKPTSDAFKIDVSNRDELKRGVVFSEILGKPKALRR